ncbi:MAG: LysR family transcriptional regulator [Kordiimonadaceae bacterium]|nr:LysR family transcriptional regulator [Kordiimonadaceae bacterium]
MDLIAIRTFCRAVEEGNLTAAAKSLHITKSVASRRIHLLEEELGVKLLSRSTRGVSATDVGSLFYERGITILADVEDAKQSVASTGQSLTGTIRLTAPRSFTDLNLKRPLLAFMELHPDLTLQLNLSDERVDIVSGGYDVGIRIADKLDDTSLIAKKLAKIHAHIVASPAYLEKHGTPQIPDDLKDHRCTLYSNLTASHQWRFEKNGKHTSVRVKGTLTSNSGNLQLASVIHGLSITALPRFFVHEALASGEVIDVLPDWERPLSHLYALYPERRLLPLKVRVFIDFLSAWYERKENTDCL